MSMAHFLRELAEFAVVGGFAGHYLGRRRRANRQAGRVRYADCPCLFCNPRTSPGPAGTVALGVYATGPDGRPEELLHAHDGISSLPALTGLSPAVPANHRPPAGNYLASPYNSYFTRMSYHPAVPAPGTVMPADIFRLISKGDLPAMSFAARQKCQGAAGSGCTCNGNCVFQCTCTWCMNQLWATPPPAARGRSRAGHAGVPGFDGKARGEFEFAAGVVLGLRQWDYPVSAQLHRVVNDDSISPAMGLLSSPMDPRDVPLLKGQTGKQLWQPGVMEARCNNHTDHKPPVEWDPVRGQECGCGFWAYWKLGAHTWNASLPVHGIVEGTGRVLIGEKGFRCQRARIVALTPGFLVDPVYHGVDRDGREKEMTEKKSKAEAWNAVIMEELGSLYPEARVFATMRAMIELFPPGEK